MIEKMGRLRLILPFGALLLVGFMMTMIVYPMVTAAPKDMPLGVLSLDEGIEGPQGSLNAGNTVVECITHDSSTDGQTPTVAWTRYETEADLQAALDAHELYAALVIPKDFTAAQLQAQSVKVEAPASTLTPAKSASEQSAASLTIVVDESKNPMAAATVESSLKALIAQAGLEAQIEHLNDANLGGGSLNAAVQFTVLPTFVLSMACSASLFVATRAKRTSSRRNRLHTAATQLGLAAVLACCIGFGITAILHGIVGLSIPVPQTGLFLWLVSFCLITLFVGCLDIAIGLGIAAIILCFACGLAAGSLPYEFLPTFWQEWLYPWVPQRWIAEGVRSIFYLGSSAWNSAAVASTTYGIVGLIALAVAPFIPKHTASQVENAPYAMRTKQPLSTEA